MERVVDEWAEVAGVLEGGQLAQLGAVGLHEQKRVAHASLLRLVDAVHRALVADSFLDIRSAT